MWLQTRVQCLLPSKDQASAPSPSAKRSLYFIYRLLLGNHLWSVRRRHDREEKAERLRSGFEGGLPLALRGIRYLHIFKNPAPNAVPVLLNLFRTLRHFTIKCQSGSIAGFYQTLRSGVITLPKLFCFLGSLLSFDSLFILKLLFPVQFFRLICFKHFNYLFFPCMLVQETLQFLIDCFFCLWRFLLKIGRKIISCLPGVFWKYWFCRDYLGYTFINRIRRGSFLMIRVCGFISKYCSP